MTTDAVTLTEDRPIPPVPDSFPARHRHRTPPREYFCRMCWGWYVSECPEHGRADPRVPRPDTTVEQERRERLAAQAETLEGQNDTAALHEGPLVYALLKWARQTYDGVSEADLAEWREDYWRRRADRRWVRRSSSASIAVGEMPAALPPAATDNQEQTADLALSISGTSTGSTITTEDLAAPVTRSAAPAPAKPRHAKDESRKP